MTSTSSDPSWDGARRAVGDGLLSILMPAYNLGDEIAANVRRVADLLAGELPLEMIVIDDGSTDNTRDELRNLQEQFPDLRLVLIDENVGKGEALRRGFEASRGSHVVFLDADLDLPPHQLAWFFDIMQTESADTVIGCKRHPQSEIDYPPHRRLMSAIYFALAKLLFGLPIHDTQTGIKLFKRAPLAWVFQRVLVKRFAFDLEILALLHMQGYRIAEAPIVLKFHGTLGGIRPASVITILMDTLAIFYRIRLLKYYQSLRDTQLPDPPPLVSIIIAYPKSSAYLQQSVDAIRRQSYTNYEILLLPDEAGSESWPEDTREIPTGAIRPAAKRNIGIESARGELVAFLDDDAYPVPEWLAKAISHFGDPSVGAVGGPGCTPPDDPLLARWGGRVYASHVVAGNYRYRYVPERVREVDDYPSCNLFVRTALARELGGFRTDYWPGEDTYLCMVLVRNLKKLIIYEPRAVVFHHRRDLFLPHLRQIGRYALHRGYFARHFPATSRRIGYMIPSLFVLGLVAGGVLAMISSPLRSIYLAVLTVYALITLASSAHRNPVAWLAIWLGTCATHVVYGTRFLQGLLVKRLPSEVQQFDHSSVTRSAPDAPPS